MKMTVTDQIKILDDKIKSNQVQYDLGREAAKISTLLSKNLLDKYGYLTGEDLGYKPNVFEKAKFEYSSLRMTLTNNTKRKTNKTKVYNKNKQDKYLVYNSQDSFAKFKDNDEFKEFPLGSIYRKLNDFQKNFNKLKIVNPQTDDNKVLKEKVLDGVGHILNELYYIYNDRYNEEKDGLNTKDKKKFSYKKLRLTDNYKYESEEEEETSKKPDKKNHLKNLIKKNDLK